MAGPIKGGGKRELMRRVTDDVLKEAWRESRVAEKLRQKTPRKPPAIKPRPKVPGPLSGLRKAESAIRRKAVARYGARLLGRVAAPLAVGLSVYDVGKAGVEGYKAYKAAKELKGMKARSEAKYGSVEKHRRALRRAKQTRRPPAP